MSSGETSGVRGVVLGGVVGRDKEGRRGMS